MFDWIQREAVYLWYYLDIQLRQIAPYWALGIVLGSAVSVFGKKYIHGAFAKIGQKKMGWLGVIPASLLGIASPLCMYGTIPIAASFSEQGVRDDYLAAFMMSSILLNPQLIFYSGALGQTALMIRCVSCFLCGCAAGWLIRLFYSGKGKSFFDFTGFHEGKSRDTDPNMLLRFLKNIWRNIKATGPMFALGILLTALYQIHVPGDFVSGLFGKNNGFGVLMAATIGVPVYMGGYENGRVALHEPLGGTYTGGDGYGGGRSVRDPKPGGSKRLCLFYMRKKRIIGGVGACRRDKEET